MEDIFKAEMTTPTPQEHDLHFSLQEAIQELRRQNKKLRKKMQKLDEKAKKKAKKAEKSKKKSKKRGEWEKLAFKSANVAIESGIPALFRKLESSGKR